MTTTKCDAINPVATRSRMNRSCYLLAGHEGVHTWERCDVGDPESGYGCELTSGHEPPHRVTVEWYEEGEL